MEDSAKTTPITATCAACNHEHKEADGSCSCGCKTVKQ